MRARPLTSKGRVTVLKRIERIEALVGLLMVKLRMLDLGSIFSLDIAIILAMAMFAL